MCVYVKEVSTDHIFSVVIENSPVCFTFQFISNILTGLIFLFSVYHSILIRMLSFSTINIQVLVI